MCPEIPSESEIAKAMQIAKNPAGQQLIELLQKGDNPALQDAMEHAKNGDYAQISHILKQLLSSPEADAIVKKIRGNE